MESKAKGSPESILGKQVSSIQTARRSIPLVGIKTIACVIIPLVLLASGSSLQLLSLYAQPISSNHVVQRNVSASRQAMIYDTTGKTEDTKDQQMLHNNAGTDNDIESCLRPKSNSVRVAKLKPPCEFNVFRT